MKFSIIDADQRPAFKGGKLVICKPEQLEQREWAPFQFSFMPRKGETVVEIPLDENGSADLTSLQTVLAHPGPLLIIVKDWAGKDYLTISVEGQQQ